MLYDRKIKYLDYYENGIKVSGGGFLKLEVRDNLLRLELAVRGLHPTDSFERDILLQSTEKEGALGQIRIQNGSGQFRFSCSPKQIGDTGISYHELCGIRISIGGTREILCKWGDDLDKRRITPSKEEFPKANTDDQEYLKEPVSDNSIDNKESITYSVDIVSGQSASEQVENEQITNIQKVNEQIANEQTINEQIVNEQAVIGQTANEQTANMKTVNKQASAPQIIIEQTVNEQTENELAANVQAINNQMTNGQPANMQVTDGQPANKQIISEQVYEWKFVGKKLEDYEEKGNEEDTGAEPEEIYIQPEPAEVQAQGAGSLSNIMTPVPSQEPSLSTVQLDKRSMDQTGSKHDPVENSGSERSDTQKAPVKLMEDKWQQLSSIYPHIQPFRDERDYLSLTPSDFVLFPTKFYRAVNNSFLLHGYYNYHHLILARIERRGEILYYIGVPGNYFEREKQVAIMFGFESFECEAEPAKTGDFGYYMMRTEL